MRYNKRNTFASRKEARAFFRNAGHHIMLVNRDPIAHQYLVQKVAVQCKGEILLLFLGVSVVLI